MAYDDTQCPCGGRKQTDTLICGRCLERVRETQDWATYNAEGHGRAVARTVDPLVGPSESRDK